MLGFFSKDIGIDLGTANTLAFEKNKGIVLREPSVVSVNTITGQVVAVGEEAKKMLGRTPGSIVAVRPLKDGVIADFEITQSMIRHFIRKITTTNFFTRPRIVICIPYGVTEVERRAVEEAAVQAGGREAFLIEEPMAAAIGAGLPIAEPTGSLIVDIGGGTSEVAVISLGGIVTSKSLRIAGDELDEAIINYVKKSYNLLIGERTAERIKENIGSAYDYGENETYEVSGRDLMNGLPKNIKVTSEEIREALKEPVGQIVDGIKTTLEQTPPELAADIIERGLTLTGGGALLKGFDTLISKETGIPVHIADNPLDCVVNGTGKVLEDIDSLKKLLLNKRR